MSICTSFNIVNSTPLMVPVLSHEDFHDVGMPIAKDGDYIPRQGLAIHGHRPDPFANSIRVMYFNVICCVAEFTGNLIPRPI